MFTLVYGNDLHDFPALGNEMFCDRRAQFSEELGWDLDVDVLGRETDEYDRMNPLYIILRDERGHHLGSTRLMPTTGPTMIADHFSDLTDGVEIESPLIWECTRFFMARRSAVSRKHAAAVMWAGCEIGLRAGVQFYVGVTASAMVRVFKACGWPAEVIGTRSDDEGEISACLWEVNEERCDALRRRAGIEKGEYRLEVYRPEAEVATPSEAMQPMFPGGVLASPEILAAA